jgi:hypothetical protein
MSSSAFSSLAKRWRPPGRLSGRWSCSGRTHVTEAHPPPSPPAAAQPAPLCPGIAGRVQWVKRNEWGRETDSVTVWEKSRR